MKTQEFKSLGLVFRHSVPTSYEEFDKNAKRENAGLEEAINNVVYRSSLAEFRDTFIHGRDEDKDLGVKAVKGAEEVFKFSRKTAETGKKDDKGNPILRYDETENDYVDRLLAHLVKERKLTEDAALAELQKLADTIAPEIAFDASQRERKPKAPKKLADKYKNIAASVIAGPHLERFLKDVKKSLAKEWTKTGDKDKDVESLGWLVKEFAEWKEKQTLAAIAG